VVANQEIFLREVTKETVCDICTLAPLENQEQFVASNAVSIAQAHFNDGYAWFRAIYADDNPVGFVMLGIDPKEDFCFLWRFMIDGRYQGMGFGRKALELVVETARLNKKLKRIITSYRKGNGNPGGFYKSLGFTEVANVDTLGDLGQRIKGFEEVALEYRL